MNAVVFESPHSTFFPQLGRSVTIDQAAQLLGVSRRTVYYRIREGRLRTIRTLGTMVHSGVPMLDAVRLSAEVAGNYYYEAIWRHVLDQITQGKRIADGLTGNPLVPKTLIQMIGAGEETGRLGDVLQKVSSYYDREVEMSLKTATSMIEPIMITAMGAVVGGIGLAIMLPIFSLSRHAS